MRFRQSWTLPVVLIYALLSTASLQMTTASPSPPPRAGQLFLSKALVGRPAATERAVFWSEVRDRRSLIRGYDLETDTAFLTLARNGMILDLAADGMRVAWVERDTAT